MPNLPQSLLESGAPREVKERPILFSGPMVRAILEGRKTQTRRVIRPQPPAHCAYLCGNPGNGWAWTDGSTKDYDYFPRDREGIDCLYGKPATRLWVREAWSDASGTAPGQPKCVLYRATYGGPSGVVFRPSIHMPRWASRITLEITDVRVQRVQDISEQDCIAEGINAPPPGLNPPGKYDVNEGFSYLWDSINEKRGYGWSVNPWVWCISFRRM